MSKIGGFFVPGSISGSYVASKKNEEGSYKYDAQAIGVGMQKQAALQDLEKSYEGTINKAYNSYLANQQNIRGSQMGQGYKELYERAEEENLIAQQEQAAMNVSQVKSQLLSQEQEAQAAIQQQYQAEVANLDRVARSMQDYLGYVKSLEGGLDYLSKLSGITVTDDTLAEDLYEALYTAQPQTLVSSEDAETKGLPFSQWLHGQLKETNEDVAFEQWLFSGGWQDFQKAAGLATDKTEEGEKYAEIESERKEKLSTELKRQEDEDVAKVKETFNFSKNWYSSPTLEDNKISRRALQEALGINLTNVNNYDRVKDAKGNEYIVVLENGKIYIINGAMSGEVSRLL